MAAPRRVGRIVVAASGNEAWSDRLADPACVPRVVRVGAVYDRRLARFATRVCEDVDVTADQVACFSNSASFLSLLAPGVVIEFAGIGMAGASQAAPHVAGAIASLRTQDRFTSDSADCTIARVLRTGTPIFDSRNGYTFPRLNLDAASLTWPNSVGNCNADGRVVTEELETGVGIAPGALPLAQCPRFDAAEDGEVTIEELVTGVNIALFGCAFGASGLT
ncbi:MAG: S8 family serine peptidase [Candidatus Binatia bacterium]|nr:S8 family serine peptidase [Candidatus Binatia bacterium]